MIFISILYYSQYTDLSYTTYPNLSKTVFAIFMVLVPILLLNMLIAMMGNTYAHVIEQSEKEWVKQVRYCIIFTFIIQKLNTNVCSISSAVLQSNKKIARIKNKRKLSNYNFLIIS